MEAEKKYTLSALRKAFAAGQKTESTYKGGGNTVVTPVFPTFEAYAKSAKIKLEEQEKGKTEE